MNVSRKKRSIGMLPVILAVVVGNLICQNDAWGLWFEVAATKDELRMKYEVVENDYKDGRSGYTLTITDPGKLERVDLIRLQIPSQTVKGRFDVSLNLKTREEDGQQVVNVELSHELARRAEFQLVQSIPFSSSYYLIPLDADVRKAQKK